ncbi:MAG: flavodoxin family protein [Spirochaetia bacterium]|jgi:multimeric flavodoxin WrbA
MKILVVQGSGRSRGNTARLDTLLEKALAAEAAAAGMTLQLERMTLADADVRPCRGCRSCFDTGETTCPLRDDDVLSMKAKMLDADALVLTGPVYINDVSGVMKNWMDRLAHVCHRPAFAGKTALLMATTGGTPARHALRSMQVPLWSWGYRVAGSMGFTTGAAMSEAELQHRYEKRLAEAARRLLREVRQKRFLRPGFVSLLIFRVQQAGWRKAAAGSLDRTYWDGKGWLDTRHCTYFFPHRTNPITTMSARLIGGLVAAFMG